MNERAFSDFFGKRLSDGFGGVSGLEQARLTVGNNAQDHSLRRQCSEGRRERAMK
jgi:hypothetical protein